MIDPKILAAEMTRLNAVFGGLKRAGPSFVIPESLRSLETVALDLTFGLQKGMREKMEEILKGLHLLQLQVSIDDAPHLHRLFNDLLVNIQLYLNPVKEDVERARLATTAANARADAFFKMRSDRLSQSTTPTPAPSTLSLSSS